MCGSFCIDVEKDQEFECTPYLQCMQVLEGPTRFTYPLSTGLLERWQLDTFIFSEGVCKFLREVWLRGKEEDDPFKHHAMIGRSGKVHTWLLPLGSIEPAVKKTYNSRCTLLYMCMSIKGIMSRRGGAYRIQTGILGCLVRVACTSLFSNF